MRYGRLAGACAGRLRRRADIGPPLGALWRKYMQGYSSSGAAGILGKVCETQVAGHEFDV
jgi:hypothetical protein